MVGWVRVKGSGIKGMKIAFRGVFQKSSLTKYFPAKFENLSNAKIFSRENLCL